MPQLPADVLFPILQYAYTPPKSITARRHTFTTRRAWIASTLLVGRAWYAAGQPLLYRQVAVNFHEKWRVNSLLRTLNSPNRAAEGTVAQTIHELHIEQNGYDEMRNHHGTFQVPSIPFVTERGRREWTRKRQYDKLRLLLVKCSALRRLKLYARDIVRLASAIEELWLQHRRLERLEVHDVTIIAPNPLWSHLVQLQFWSHLPDLKLQAQQDSGVLQSHEQLGGFRSALACGRLESLEVSADVHATLLREILRLVRSTLRTLVCDQPIGMLEDMSNGGIFAPVAGTLTSLTLTLHSHVAFDDLSSMTALVHVTFILIFFEPSSLWRRARLLHSQPSSVQKFPPALETIEWRAKRGVDPWILAERVRDTLRAWDHNRLVGLRSITVAATLQFSRQVRQWTILATLLHRATETRPGVQLWVDLLLDLNHLELHRFDFFTREANARRQQKLEDWNQKVQKRDQGWRRVLHRGLETGGRMLDCVHTSVCCVLHVGCCCCVLGR